MSVAPPIYAFSPAPSYASLPCTGHSTVEYTPRAGRSEAPTGTLSKQWRDLTVIFKNQASDSDADAVPSYGRNSTIYGEVGPEDPDSILTISLKFEGRIDLSSSDCGSLAQKVIDERRTLWDVSTSGRCPSVVGFAVAFPMTYTDHDRIYRVPPSYEIICLGTPLIVVKCFYRLSFTVSRTSTRRLSFKKTSSKTYYTPIHFKPRTRPARPLIQDASFLSSVKAAPSEWHQMVVTIPARQQATVEPITCHFILPSVQAFSLNEEIPFHIQLCGSPTSLGVFYGSITPEALHPGKKARRRHYSAVVRVFLARQIYVELNGRQSWRTLTVGEGKLRPVPPSHNEHGDALEVSVDWEGEVRCKNDVTCASFNINHLVVKDFLIFALTPANVRASPLLPIQHAHPIRLVTDGWTDNEMAHPEDR